MRRRLLNRPQRCDSPPPPAQDEDCNVGDVSGVAALESDSSSSDSSSWGDSIGQNEDCGTPGAAAVGDEDECDLTNVTPLSSECSSSESSSTCEDSFGLNEERPPAALDESRYSTYWEDFEQGWVDVDEDDLEYTISEEEEEGLNEEPEPERTFGDELFQMAGYSDVWDFADMFPGCENPEEEDIARESVLRRDEQMANIPLEPSTDFCSEDAVNPDETGYSSIHECEFEDDPQGRLNLMRRRRWVQYERGLEAGDDVGPLIQQFRDGLSPRHRSPGSLAVRRMIQDSPGWAGHPNPNATRWSFDASGAGDCSEMYSEDDDEDVSDFSPMFTSSPNQNEWLQWTC